MSSYRDWLYNQLGGGSSSGGSSSGGGLQDVVVAAEYYHDEYDDRRAVRWNVTPESGKRYILDAITDDGETRGNIFIIYDKPVTQECQIWIKFETWEMTDARVGIVIDGKFNRINTPDLDEDPGTDCTHFIASIENDAIVWSRLTIGESLDASYSSTDWLGGGYNG